MSFSEKLNLNVTVVFQLFQSQTAVPVNAGAADWLSGVCKESELRILVAQRSGFAAWYSFLWP